MWKVWISLKFFEKSGKGLNITIKTEIYKKKINLNLIQSKFSIIIDHLNYLKNYLNNQLIQML